MSCNSGGGIRINWTLSIILSIAIFIALSALKTAFDSYDYYGGSGYYD